MVKLRLTNSNDVNSRLIYVDILIATARSDRLIVQDDEQCGTVVTSSGQLMSSEQLMSNDSG